MKTRNKAGTSTKASSIAALIKINEFRIFFYFMLVARVANLIFSFPAKSGGDSISYRQPAIPQSLPWYIDKFTYLPDAYFGRAQRPWLPVAIFAWSGNDQISVFVLSLLSLAAWMFLFYAFQKTFFRYLNTASQIVFSICVLVIANSPEVLAWNRLIYSESLAISAGCIFFGSSLLFLQHKSSAKTLILWSISAFSFATTRENYIFSTVIMGLILLYKIIKSGKNLKSLLLSLIVFITLIFSTIYNNQINESWKHQVSRPLVTISYYLSDDSALADQALLWVNHDVTKPPCVQISNKFASGQQLLWSLPFKKTCPSAITWADHAVYRLLLNLAIHHPKELSVQLSRTMLAGTRYYPYLSGLTPVPLVLHSAIFAEFQSTHVRDDYETRGSVNSFFTFDPLLLWVTLLFLLYFQRKTWASNKERKQFASYVGAIIGGLILSWISVAILLPGPDSESYRLAIVSNVFTRLFVVVLFFLYLPNNQPGRENE